MWSYQKRLQYPVNIKNTNPRLAQYVVAQYGGPYGKGYEDEKRRMIQPITNQT